MNKKVRAVLAHAMTPILCVGETLEEREAGGTESKVPSRCGGRSTTSRRRTPRPRHRLRAHLGDRTGRNAEPWDAGEVIELIRGTIARAYGDTVAQGVRIQYGGSVKPGNIRDFMAHPEIDGALVGGASLDPEDFALIVKYR